MWHTGLILCESNSYQLIWVFTRPRCPVILPVLGNANSLQDSPRTEHFNGDSHLYFSMIKPLSACVGVLKPGTSEHVRANSAKHSAKCLWLFFSPLYEPRACIAFFFFFLLCVWCAQYRSPCGCVPWVMLNKDITGHYCPLLSMVNGQYMSSSYLNKIPANNHYHPEWTRHWLCLEDRKQQQRDNFWRLRNRLLLLHTGDCSHV